MANGAKSVQEPQLYCRGTGKHATSVAILSAAQLYKKSHLKRLAIGE